MHICAYLPVSGCVPVAVADELLLIEYRRGDAEVVHWRRIGELIDIFCCFGFGIWINEHPIGGWLQRFHIYRKRLALIPLAVARSSFGRRSCKKHLCVVDRKLNCRCATIGIIYVRLIHILCNGRPQSISWNTNRIKNNYEFVFINRNVLRRLLPTCFNAYTLRTTGECSSSLQIYNLFGCLTLIDWPSNTYDVHVRNIVFTHKTFINISTCRWSIVLYTQMHKHKHA